MVETIPKTLLAQNYMPKEKWIPVMVLAQTELVSYTVQTKDELVWRRHADQLVARPHQREDVPWKTKLFQMGLGLRVQWWIEAGSLVLDPMCGLGTILLEAAKEWPTAYYHGVDNTASQLQMASANVCFAKLTNSIDLMRASVT
eukprot:g36633.t1